MQLAQYGITLPIVFLYIFLGILIGKLWQQYMLRIFASHRESSFLHEVGKAVVILVLFFISLVTSYLLVGVMLTCFIYSAIASGILGEWGSEILLSFCMYCTTEVSKLFVHKKLSVDTNLHTLHEAAAESHSLVAN